MVKEEKQGKEGGREEEGRAYKSVTSCLHHFPRSCTLTNTWIKYQILQ